MELKLEFSDDFIAQVLRFNCTFMELKYVNTLETGTSQEGALIVPLWNWNMLSIEAIPLPSDCFNCTFMELKSHQRHLQHSLLRALIVPLWNWNTDCSLSKSRVAFALIVPLWNWNSSSSSWLTATPRFNCTFMELKCLLLHGEQQTPGL